MITNFFTPYQIKPELCSSSPIRHVGILILQFTPKTLAYLQFLYKIMTKSVKPAPFPKIQSPCIITNYYKSSIFAIS